jgi:hypothetical protein
MGEEDCFARVCGHKAQTGARMVAEALNELEICGDRTTLEKEALAHARRNLAALNLMLHVIVVTNEKRRFRLFDA